MENRKLWAVLIFICGGDDSQEPICRIKALWMVRNKTNTCVFLNLRSIYQWIPAVTLLTTKRCSSVFCSSLCLHSRPCCLCARTCVCVLMQNQVLNQCMSTCLWASMRALSSCAQRASLCAEVFMLSLRAFSISVSRSAVSSMASWEAEKGNWGSKRNCGRRTRRMFRRKAAKGRGIRVCFNLRFICFELFEIMKYLWKTHTVTPFVKKKVCKREIKEILQSEAVLRKQGKRHSEDRREW